MNESWSPTSWRKKPIVQQVNYPDRAALKESLKKLSRLPPLVTSWEVETLKSQLAEASRGERFILQGGDCAESFDDCRSEAITSKLKILLKMSIILMYGMKRKVTRLGRFAGQYAKPRSADTETRDGITLPSYRGDLINRPPFTLEDRTPDPNLMLRGHERAAMTLNFIRSLVQGAFADFRLPELWDIDFVDCAAQAQYYHQVMDGVTDAIQFLETATGRPLTELGRVEFFASHEGLQLDYERAHTRQVPRRLGYYDLSTHFPWIGDRTRAPGGAHVEFFRGISNPIGMKVGPTMDPGELSELLDILNPEDEPGRLTLIHRFGAKQIENFLPPLIEAVKQRGRTVVWVCDPMHGNTITTDDGIKTRRFNDILTELSLAFDVHRRHGSILGGVHFELTGENVTECVGGARGLAEEDLKWAYRSDVDPRLNYEQALEMAILIAQHTNREQV